MLFITDHLFGMNKNSYTEGRKKSFTFWVILPAARVLGTRTQKVLGTKPSTAESLSDSESLQSSTDEFVSEKLQSSAISSKVTEITSALINAVHKL